MDNSEDLIQFLEGQYPNLAQQLRMRYEMFLRQQERQQVIRALKRISAVYFDGDLKAMQEFILQLTP